MSEKIYISEGGIKYKLIDLQEGTTIDFYYDDEDGSIKYDESKYDITFFVDDDGILNVYPQRDSTIDDNGILNIYGSVYTKPEIIKDTDDALLQKNINLIRQRNKSIRLKVSLLESNYIEVESITGKIVSISYGIDSSSDVRRTCSLTLSVPTKEQISIDFQKTWNRRLVELYCGIYSNEEKEMKWFSLGRMLMKSGNTTFSATEQEIQLNLVDLMASITSDRGNPVGSSYRINAGVNVKSVITALITQYTSLRIGSIPEFEDTIPYDLDVSIGSYPIDVLHTILDLFPYYEMFYNNKGEFIIQKIPQSKDEPVALGCSVIDDLIISENSTMDYSTIKNTTEIVGRVLSSNYTFTNVETINKGDHDCYNGYIDSSYETMTMNEKFSITPLTDSKEGQTLQIQNLEECLIYNSNGSGNVLSPIKEGDMKSGYSYSLRYVYELDENGNKIGKFILLGELYVHAIVMEINADEEDLTPSMIESFKQSNGCNTVKFNFNKSNPFACTISNGFILGEMRQVLQGGEYSAIYSSSLALERANYENYLSCRLKDTVTIEMILIPWLDVNQKIEFTMPSSGEVAQWLIKSINYDFDLWTMEVECSRFDNRYPWYE